MGEQMLPVIEKKQDFQMKKVLDLVDTKYGRTHLEKVKKYVQNWIDLREDQFEEEGKLSLAVWKLGVKKRKWMEAFHYQALRNVMKEGR